MTCLNNNVATVAACAKAQGLPWDGNPDNEVSVLDFGAQGNLTANDLNAFQMAIDAVYAMGGGSVVVSGNVDGYLINGTIIIKSGITLKGPGLVRQGLDNTILFSSGGASVSEVRFIGLNLEGKGDYIDLTGRLARGISIYSSASDRSEDVEISGCRFYNFGWASIDIRNTEKFRISRNIIIGPGSPTIPGGGNYCFGINLWDDVSEGVVNGNLISDTAQGIFGGVNFSRITISGNTISRIVGQHGMYLNQSSDVSVVSNTVSDCFHSGIKIQIAENASGDCENVGFVGNTIRQTGSHAILINNVFPGEGFVFRNINVCGNTIFDGQSDAGVYIAYATHSRVSDNQIQGKWYGVRCVNCAHTRIIDNDTHDTYKQGILVDTPDYVFVLRNRVTDPGNEPLGASRFGIYATGDGNCNIEGNVVWHSNPAQLVYALYLLGMTGANLTLKNNVLDGVANWSTLTSFKEFSGNSITTQPALPADPQLGTNNKVYFGSTPPATGRAGDFCNGTAPGNEGAMGWTCTAAPGTWARSGLIESTSLLNWDWTNKTMGIGMAAPSTNTTILQVGKSLNGVVEMRVVSNVGLGNTSAGAQFRASGSGVGAYFGVRPIDSSTTRFQDAGIVGLESTAAKLVLDANSASQVIEAYVGSTSLNFKIDRTSTAGETDLSLRDQDSNLLQRIKVGANGTGPGGTGRALYMDDV